jgi:hypothetical protein
LDIPTPSNLSVKEGQESASHKDDRISFNDSMFETMLNFLVRLKILLADPKIDTVAVDTQPKLDSLLKEIVELWISTTGRPAYFDKVVSMCIEDEERLVANGGARKTKDGIRTGKGPNSTGRNPSLLRFPTKVS